MFDIEAEYEKNVNWILKLELYWRFRFVSLLSSWFDYIVWDLIALGESFPSLLSNFNLHRRAEIVTFFPIILSYKQSKLTISCQSSWQLSCTYVRDNHDIACMRQQSIDLKGELKSIWIELEEEAVLCWVVLIKLDWCAHSPPRARERHSNHLNLVIYSLSRRLSEHRQINFDDWTTFERQFDASKNSFGQLFSVRSIKFSLSLYSNVRGEIGIPNLMKWANNCCVDSR